MQSFDTQPKRHNSEWRAETSPRKKTARRSHDVQKVTHVTSSAEMDLGLTITWQLVRRSMANITAHSCRKSTGGSFAVTNQNCLSMSLFLLRYNARSHQHIEVQTVVHRWGWEVLAYPPYSPDLSPCDY
jgi:hypothetical protein